MVKKLTLDIDYSDNFLILGIVSVYTDYQLVHYVNKTLGFDFIKYADFSLTDNTKSPITYSWFYCKSDELKVKSYFIANHHAKQKLLPDFKQIDYLLIIDNSENFNEAGSFITSLRKVKGITGVFKIDPQKIKNISLLLEKNEMHELAQIK